MPWSFWPRRKKIPRITLRITPNLAVVSPGGSTSSTLEIEMTEARENVALSASDVPGWAIVTFNPPAGIPQIGDGGLHFPKGAARNQHDAHRRGRERLEGAGNLRFDSAPRVPAAEKAGAVSGWVHAAIKWKKLTSG